MKILVTDEALQRGVALSLPCTSKAWQVLALADERGGVAMLQAAIALVHRVEHEEVIFKRWLAALAVPERDGGFTNFLRIGQEACAVKARASTRHHKAVRHARRHEFSAPKLAQLKGRVGQRVVVGCAVAAPAIFIAL